MTVIKNNRREFFKMMGYAGAGLWLIPGFFSNQSCTTGTIKTTGTRLKGLLPVFLIDDCINLALASGRLNITLHETLQADVNLNLPGNKARLAGVATVLPEQLVELLEKLKPQYRMAPADRLLQGKIAVASGMAALIPAQALFANATGGDRSLSLDVKIARAIAARDNSVSPDPGHIAGLLKEILPRAITRTHTIKPDYDDGIGWVNRMAEWRKHHDSLADKTGLEWTKPSNTGNKEFNPSDTIIQLALRLRDNAEVGAQDIIQAVEKSSKYSLYGKALAKGFKNICLTSDFLDDRIESGELKFS
jgi:hypothetical protein